MSDRPVPIAYVTKWATTAGIRIVRNVVATESGYLTERHSTIHLFVPESHWTEDKAEAEKRYRFALAKAKNAAERKLDALRRKLDAAPKYTEG